MGADHGKRMKTTNKNSIRYRSFRAILPFLLLALCIAIFYNDTLFRGRSQSWAGNLYDDALYQSLKPQGWAFANVSDPASYLQTAPWEIYAAQDLRRGEVPLWNPYSGAGVPFLANWVSGVFSPFKIPIYLRPTMRIFDCVLVLRVFLSGVFMFMLARRLGGGMDGSILAMIAYAFGGAMTTYFHLFSWTFATLPLFFLSLYNLIALSSIRSIILVSLTMTLLIISGHPGITIYSLLGGTVWFFAYLFNNRVQKGKIGKIVRLATLALVTGALLSAIVLLPFIDYFLKSYTTHSLEGPSYFTFTRFLIGAIGLIVPLPLSGFPWTFQTYAGPFVLILALFHLFGPGRDIAFFTVAIFGLCEYFVLPPISWIHRLPIMNHVPPHYSVGLISLALSVMAGKGLDEQMKKGSIVIGWLGSALCFFMLILIISSAWKGVEKIVVLRSIQALIFTLAMVITARTVKRKGGFIAWVIVPLTFLDLFLSGFRWAVPTPHFEFIETPPIRWLKDQPGVFRVLGMTGKDIQPNTGMVHALGDPRAIEPIVPRRYARFILLAASYKGLSRMAPLFVLQHDQPLIDLLNVKYLIASSNTAGTSEIQAAPLPVRKWIPVYRDAYTIIYENRDVQPRAFVLDDVRLAASESEAYEMLRQGRIDTRKTIVLEVDNPTERETTKTLLAAGSRTSSGSHTSEAEAIIEHYVHHTVRVRAVLPTSGVLFLGDIYDPDWRVVVDGVRRKMYPVDYLFRGVVLTPGEHIVEYFYDPWSFKVGTAVTSFTLILLGAALLMSGRNRRVRNSTARETNAGNGNPIEVLPRDGRKK